MSGTVKSCPPKLLVLILSVVYNAMVSVEMSSANEPKQINLKESLNIPKQLPCSEPQARAYNLGDLMKNLYQNPGEITNRPVYIIVKRCDVHSGCCGSPSLGCSPDESAIYFDEIETEITGVKAQKRQWIRVEQHGGCTCKEMTTSDRQGSANNMPNVTLSSRSRVDVF